MPWLLPDAGPVDRKGSPKSGPFGEILSDIRTLEYNLRVARVLKAVDVAQPGMWPLYIEV